jgi:hypothetical protein
MVNPETGEQIQLALAQRDAQGRYDVAEVRLERSPRRERVVYREDFAHGAHGWTAPPGLRIEAGGDGLGISGRETVQSWGYASVRVDLLPFSRYRLSLQMKVETVDPQLPPYAKIGVNAADGRWITNFNTNQYDLTQTGTWQRLVAYADTPGETASGDLSIEKGQLETPVTARVVIRDVKLELLESP